MYSQLKHLAGTIKPDDPTLFSGIYADKKEWAPNEVRALAYMTPSNLGPADTKGLYHLRSIKHKYPIPGTQLLRERQREIAATAQKKLIFLKSSNQPKHQASRAAHEDCLHTLEQGKLNYMASNLLRTLEENEHALNKDKKARQIRLTTLQGDIKLVERFWQCLFNGQTRLACLMVTQHEFIDVNLPVLYNIEKKNISIESGRSFELALTPLMAAARLHNVEVVKALLANGADSQLYTANDDTALHFAMRDVESSNQSIKWAVSAKRACIIVEQLLLHQALPNHQNSHGSAVLHDCARLGQKEAIEHLIKFDANVHLKDLNGNSPLDLAKANGYYDLWCFMATHKVIENAREDCALRSLYRSHSSMPGKLNLSWSPP
ncbi:hypothetical protein THRCLA_09754, partial [Thraustotheca clavata]